MQKKSLLIIAMLGLISVSFLLASPMVAAQGDQWVPDDKVPGYKRIAGQEINLSGEISLIVVDYIRVDVWGKGSDPNAPEAIVISIAIKNTTNIFDAALPPEIQTIIDQYLGSLSTGGVTLEIHTIWELIRFAVPILTAQVSTIDYLTLTRDDYYYFDEGMVIWTSDITLALAKDENLALIVASFAIDPAIIVNDPELETKITGIITEINGLINEGLSGVGYSPLSVYRSPDTQPDTNALFILDQLSGQYGTNDYEPGLLDNIPGFPVGILGLITLLGIIVLVRKYR